MRLIDADELMEHAWRDKLDSRELIAKMIENAPTVASVRHGRWILDEYPHDGDCRCSVCRMAVNQMHERNHHLLDALTGGKWWTFYKYCPHCGAKMEG